METPEKKPALENGQVIATIPRELIRRFMKAEAEYDVQKSRLRARMRKMQRDQALLYDEAYDYIKDAKIEKQVRAEEICIRINTNTGDIVVMHQHQQSGLNFDMGEFLNFVSENANDVQIIDLGIIEEEDET